MSLLLFFPSAAPQGVAGDRFDGTRLNDWVADDYANAYIYDFGSAADYDVAAGVGTMSHGAVNTNKQARVAVALADVRLAARLRWPVVSTGANRQAYLHVRTDANTNYYRVALVQSTTGALTAQVQTNGGTVIAGPHTLLAAGNYVAGTVVNAWLEADGSTITAKVWVGDGTAEPADDFNTAGSGQFQVTDTTVTAAGDVAIRSFIGSGNTNTNPQVEWLDWQAFELAAAPTDVTASGSFSGAGAFAASAVRGRVGAASFAGVAAFSGAAVRGRVAAGAFSGTGSFSATAVRTRVAAGSFSAVGAFQATAVRGRRGAGSFSGQGSFQASAVILRAASGSFAGSSVFTAATVGQRAAAGAFSSSGTFTATAVTTRIAGGAFAANAAFNAEALRGVSASGAFAGTAEFTASVAGERVTSGSFAGSSSFAATAYVSGPGEVIVVPGGGVVVSSTLPRDRPAPLVVYARGHFDAAATFDAAAYQTRVAAGSFAGIGWFYADAVQTTLDELDDEDALAELIPNLLAGAI